ncbi:MFS transporter [Microbacterium capsulatum]|uniref:MFS transporter n=1 Tax=Microbacterium capsulatum TaxID=3041921 RepID=A0ABU0XIX2_9MICO|nr:MFS transporter [Microbacterium sp. ASV81]MDQ4214080.1 MFS transporter [Microbacterium sp. ASV81]
MHADDQDTTTRAAKGLLRPWHFIIAFGVVSLLADMVYEGARSIIGPYLATLGASATVVGIVAGAGEFIGYGLRVVTGYAVVRTRHYWTWTIVGYALTVLSVPLIGVTGVIAPALLLYGTERLGKAVRSPAKDTLLSHASARTGRGSAFGVHQALDQTGAVLGPLLLAAVLGWRDGDYALAFGVLIVPGVLVLALLFWLRHRVPDPLVYETPAAQERQAAAVPSAARPAAPLRRGLPGRFWLYVAAIAVLSAGIASFPLLAYHAQSRHLLTDAQVPILFAVAMFVDGASGLVMGRAYDRFGPRTLYLVPVAAGVAAIAFTQSVALIWIGVAVWGVVNGILDSTVKAVVTELVPSASRAIAFGWLAFVRGAGLLVAGAVLGFAYDRGAIVVIATALVANALGLIGLVLVLRTVGSAKAVSGP